ncbi:hypothetical protein GCM10020331_047430 [Ectobacillus funiculus]
MCVTLDTPVTDLKGIGEETAVILHEMGLFTVGDLLEHFSISI